MTLSPLSGSGFSQVFSATFTHEGGIDQVYLGYLLFLPTSNTVWYNATGACLIEYNRISRGMRLIDNAGTGWLGPVSGIVLGPNAGTLSNNQCAIDIAGASAIVSGNNMVVTVPVTFKNALTPVLATFLQTLDVKAKWTGMTQFGNWVVPGGAPRNGPSIVGVASSTDSGSYAVYTATLNNTAGAAKISMVHLLAGNAISDAAPCQVVYYPGSRMLNLINDAGTGLVSTTGIEIGVSGSLSNSRCSVNTRLGSQSLSGASLTVTIPINFQPSTFAGLKNIYMNVFDDSGRLTHWVQAGTLTVK